MKYTELGKTGIKVSRICVGCMSYGKPYDDFQLWTLDQDKTTEMIKYALDNGVNFLDTANCYARGSSEEFVGKALKDLGVKREDVVLASKVYFNEGKLQAQAITREIEGTLKRLGTDYLDLYQIHRFDYETPIEETMTALDKLVKEGKVRAIGASAMYGYQFYNMQMAAERNGLTPFSTMQDHYNMLYREDERELIPICKQMNVSLIPYSPLASGHLTRPTWNSDSKRSETDKTQHAKYDHAMENDMKIVERVAEVAKQRGITMTEVALAWLFKKGVTAPIVGATKPHHFADAIKSVDVELTDEEMKYLDEPYIPHPVVGPLEEGPNPLPSFVK